MTLRAFLGSAFGCVNAGKPLCSPCEDPLMWNILLFAELISLVSEIREGNVSFSPLGNLPQSLIISLKSLIFFCFYLGPGLTLSSSLRRKFPFTLPKYSFSHRLAAKRACVTQFYPITCKQNLASGLGEEFHFLNEGTVIVETLSLTASLEFWCDAWILVAILQPWGTRP